MWTLPEQIQWQQAPDGIDSVVRGLQVWRVNFDAPNWSVQELGTTLSSSETKRANRYKFDHLRRRFIIARATLRHILSLQLETRPAEIEFAYGRHGKPGFTMFGGKMYQYRYR